MRIGPFLFTYSFDSVSSLRYTVRVKMSFPLKLVTLLLLLPVLCMGFLCEGALPLCECGHSCHAEAAGALYLPAEDVCGHDHGTECREHHVDERLAFYGAESRVRPVGALTTVTLLTPLALLPERTAGGLLYLAHAPVAARGPDIGRISPLRC